METRRESAGLSMTPQLISYKNIYTIGISPSLLLWLGQFYVQLLP